MKRNKEALESRKAYIKKRLMHGKNLTIEVKRVADELYISERTVWRVYKAIKANG